MKAGELRGILRGRDFRRLYATRLASQFTDGVFQVALAGYVFFSPEQRATAGEAAAAFAVTLLPYSVLGPFAGVFIDRWRRRQILVWAPVLRAALVLLVAALVATGRDGAGFFLGALLVLGVNRFFLAALSAGLPHVVSRRELVLANAFSVTSGTVIAFVGGGVGALLRWAFGAGHAGTAAILAASAGLYLLAGTVATAFPRGRLGPPAGERAGHGSAREALGGVVDGLRDGARHLGRRPPAALALGAIAYHRFLYGVVLIMTLLLCRYRFTGDADAGMALFTIMLGASGAGFFVGAVATPPVVRRTGKDAWTAGLLAAGGVGLFVLGLPFDETAWAAAAFVLGVVSQGVKLCVDATLQETVDDRFRGRVFAVYDMLFNAVFALAAAVAAVSLPADGRAPLALALVIVAYGVGAIGYRAMAARAPERVAVP
ncbi:MFS transporter [Actinomadura sp. WMMB 499]|uniref:MFS transporter n=1 Tax=Actinomadura sp. WMMB 499 TaxID=1219491 RepID=UPI001246B090|nr:MFS transporter [Actinomadura sp. WMMB 499]QFG23172.1 MFS transporter [Actinomadura sp. WMMB 499]